jgi:hypothetical protein
MELFKILTTHHEVDPVVFMAITFRNQHKTLNKKAPEQSSRAFDLI